MKPFLVAIALAANVPAIAESHSAGSALVDCGPGFEIQHIERNPHSIFFPEEREADGTLISLPHRSGQLPLAHLRDSTYIGILFHAGRHSYFIYSEAIPLATIGEDHFVVSHRTLERQVKRLLGRDLEVVQFAGEFEVINGIVARLGPVSSTYPDQDMIFDPKLKRHVLRYPGKPHLAPTQAALDTLRLLGAQFPAHFDLVGSVIDGVVNGDRHQSYQEIAGTYRNVMIESRDLFYEVKEIHNHFVRLWPKADQPYFFDADQFQDWLERSSLGSLEKNALNLVFQGIYGAQIPGEISRTFHESISQTVLYVDPESIHSALQALRTLPKF